MIVETGSLLAMLAGLCTAVTRWVSLPWTNRGNPFLGEVTSCRNGNTRWYLVTRRRRTSVFPLQTSRQFATAVATWGIKAGTGSALQKVPAGSEPPSRQALTQRRLYAADLPAGAHSQARGLPMNCNESFSRWNHPTPILATLPSC